MLEGKARISKKARGGLSLKLRGVVMGSAAHCVGMQWKKINGREKGGKRTFCNRRQLKKGGEHSRRGETHRKTPARGEYRPPGDRSVSHETSQPFSDRVEEKDQGHRMAVLRAADERGEGEKKKRVGKG